MLIMANCSVPNMRFIASQLGHLGGLNSGSCTLKSIMYVCAGRRVSWAFNLVAYRIPSNGFPMSVALADGSCGHIYQNSQENTDTSRAIRKKS